MLASKWLAAGFDSEPLRQLAQLLSALAALDLMPVALKSIGFDPAAADEVFTAPCQSALDIVQCDLDATDTATTGCEQVLAPIRRGGSLSGSSQQLVERSKVEDGGEVGDEFDLAGTGRGTGLRLH